MKNLPLVLISSISSARASDSWNKAEIQTAPDGKNVFILMRDMMPLTVHKDEVAVAMCLSTDNCASHPLLLIIQVGTSDKSGSVILKINQQPVKFTRVLTEGEAFSMGSGPDTEQGEYFFRQAFVNGKDVNLEIDDKLYTISSKDFGIAITKLQGHCQVTKKYFKNAL